MRFAFVDSSALSLISAAGWRLKLALAGETCLLARFEELLGETLYDPAAAIPLLWPEEMSAPLPLPLPLPLPPARKLSRSPSTESESSPDALHLCSGIIRACANARASRPRLRADAKRGAAMSAPDPEDADCAAASISCCSDGGSTSMANGACCASSVNISSASAGVKSICKLPELGEKETSIEVAVGLNAPVLVDVKIPSVSEDVPNLEAGGKRLRRGWNLGPLRVVAVLSDLDGRTAPSVPGTASCGRGGATAIGSAIGPGGALDGTAGMCRTSLELLNLTPGDSSEAAAVVDIEEGSSDPPS